MGRRPLSWRIISVHVFDILKARNVFVQPQDRKIFAIPSRREKLVVPRLNKFFGESRPNTIRCK
jgi:hypothetical protein